MDREPPLSLCLYLLGGFRVERSGKVLPVSAWGRRTSARTLVKLLALDPRHQLHREEIIDRLWPEVDPDSALNRLGKALHAARRALEPDLPSRSESSYLTLSDDLLTLNSSAIFIDVDHFETLARQALDSRMIVTLEGALAAYPGDLLPEDRYEDWSIPRRDALATLHDRVALAAAETFLQRGLTDRAEALWIAVLARDPVCEEAYRGLMRLYVATGARSQALRQYELVREALQRDLGADPEPATEELYREILEGHLSPPLVGVVPPRPPPPDDSAFLPFLHGAFSRPVVGRERVLEILRGDLDAVFAGDGGLVLLNGELGVGKTRLMAEVARDAHSRGALVLWGGSFSQERTIPYGPFIEAIEAFLAHIPPDYHADLATRYSTLGLIIPALAHGPEPSMDEATDPELLHARIIARFAGLLAELSSRQPILLALDDLHAADASTLALLLHLVQPGRNRRCLILCTCRIEDVEVTSEVFRFLNTVRRDSLGRRISLGRLPREDAGQMARSLLPDGQVSPSLIDRLYALSLGNPLYLHELVRAMQDEGTLMVDDGWWSLAPNATQALPAQVADLVAARFSHVDADTRRVLNLAAVKGMEFSIPSLFSAADRAFSSSVGKERLLDILDTALALDILEDRGEVYAFRHPLLRAALLRQLPTHRRSHLHGAVASALETERPEDLDALAYHFARGDDPQKAVSYLAAAANRARLLHANSSAATYYADLLPRLDALGWDAEAASTRRAYALVLNALGRYDDALDALEHAAATGYASGDITSLAYTIAQIAQSHFLAGTAHEGLARLDALTTSLHHEIPPLPRAALSSSRASIYWLAGRYVEALQSAEAALELVDTAANDSHAPRIRASALTWRAIALQALDREAESIPALEVALDAAVEVDDLLNVSRAANTLAFAYGERGDVPRAAEYLQRAVDAAEALGSPIRRAFMAQRLGWLMLVIGRWSEARDHFERSLALSQESGPSWVTPYPLYGLAALSLAEGTWNGIDSLVKRCLAAATIAGDVRMEWAGAYILAEREVLQGNGAEARAHLLPFFDHPALSLSDRTALHALLVEACVLQGDITEAQRLVDLILAQDRPRPPLSAIGDILRARARLALATNDLQGARHSLEEALDAAAHLTAPYAEARTLVLLGHTALQAGNDLESSTHFAQALQIFQTLGATRHAAQTQAALDRLHTNATA